MTPKSIRRGLVTVSAVLLGLAVAASAWAEMFYREEAKDGRIYVFAQSKEYEAWAKSGETGKAIQKLGYGPSGETVVFDSEDAINLYNFKHNLPGEVFHKAPEAPKPKEESFVKVGATIFTDFTYTDAPQIVDSDKHTVKKSEFEVRRAYINVTGNITDLFSFRITPDIAARQTTTTTVTPPTAPAGTPVPPVPGVAVAGSLDGSEIYRLKYAFGQFNLDKALNSKGSWIRFGQQQTPYIDFMEQIYRYRFQGTTFTEREGFQSSADVGISGHYNFPGEYGDVHVGYYNGDTYTKAEPNDQKAFEGRASFRPLPKADIFKGLRLHFFYLADHPVDNAERKRFVFTTTFEHKYLNFGFDYIDAKDSASATKPVVEGQGWSVWIEPRSGKSLEGLFRYDDLKPNKSVDAKKNRTIAGVSYWFKDKMPLAACLLADYEQVNYDKPLNKPTEKRFELKALFNF